MSHKGWIYKYPLESTSGIEIDRVATTYELAGWKEIGFEPEEGVPTHIIFEWQLESIPLYPGVSWK